MSTPSHDEDPDVDDDAAMTVFLRNLKKKSVHRISCLSSFRMTWFPATSDGWLKEGRLG